MKPPTQGWISSASPQLGGFARSFAPLIWSTGAVRRPDGQEGKRSADPSAAPLGSERSTGSERDAAPAQPHRTSRQGQGDGQGAYFHAVAAPYESLARGRPHGRHAPASDVAREGRRPRAVRPSRIDLLRRKVVKLNSRSGCHIPVVPPAQQPFPNEDLERPRDPVTSTKLVRVTADVQHNLTARLNCRVATKNLIKR